MTFIIIHDLPSNVPGKTWKELNLEIPHNIPIGTLVELESGARLFVVHHYRDCDGTPLYALSIENYEEHKSFGGYPEYFLRVVSTDDSMDDE